MLHRLRHAPHVHQHDRCFVTGCNLDHGRVLKTGHVIDRYGPQFEAGLGDLRLKRIDRNWRVDSPGQSLEHRSNPLQLLFPRDGIGSRARALPADIDDVSAVGDHPASVLDGLVGIEKASAVGEGVRGDVQDTHDERPAAVKLKRAPFRVGHWSITLRGRCGSIRFDLAGPAPPRQKSGLVKAELLSM